MRGAGKGNAVKFEKGRIRGTRGTSKLPSLTSAQLAKHSALAQSLNAAGWSPWYCRRAAQAA